MRNRLILAVTLCSLVVGSGLVVPARLRADANCDIGTTTSPSGCDAGCLSFSYTGVTSQFPCGTFAVTLERRVPGGTWGFTGQSSNQSSATLTDCPAAGTYEYRFKLVCKLCGITEYYALGTFTCP